MSTFTDEFERRLRAVLSLRVQAPLPHDIPIEVVGLGGGSDGEEISPRRELELRTTAHPYAAWSYEEPGAWGKLLADLEAIPDAPADPAAFSIDGTEVTAAYRRLVPGNAANGVYVATTAPDVNQIRKTALDVVGPLAPEESELLVMLADKARPRLDGAQLTLAAALAEHGRGLTYLRGDYWSLTVLGLDVAAEIKASAKPASPPLAFVSVGPVRIPIRADEGATQWFAWDALGAKYYLRFRAGRGTVEAVYSTRSNYTVREFYHGGSNEITLEEFAQLAGIDVSQIPEDQRR